MSKKSINSMPNKGVTYQKTNKGFIPPKKAKKTWNKEHTIVMILIIIWTIGTVLGSIAFFRTNKKDSMPVAKADSLTNFVTVPIEFQVVATVSASSASSVKPIEMNIVNIAYTFSFSVNSDGTLINKPYKGLYVPSQTRVDFNTINNSFFSTSSSWSIDLTSNTLPNLPDTLPVTEYKYFNNNTNIQYYDWETTYSYFFKLTGVYPYATTASLGIYCSEIPINFLQLYKVNFLLEPSSDKLVQKTVTYFDIYGNFIAFNSLYIDTQPTFFNYDRYIQSNLDENAEYQSGFNAGYIQGENDGYSSGFNQGEQIGYDSGYYQGKIDGASQANDYTFLALMGSVIDAPIQAVGGLLNFNFLGINMSDFFFGLLTMCLFIAVAKLVLKSVV